MRDNITLIWDWNGTLLDDINICIECINVLLLKYQLNLISKESYREIFTFPVQKYYQKLGFDFSKIDFRIISEEFIAEYNSQLSSCKLFPDVIKTLKFFKKKGNHQLIISAMEHKILVKSIQQRGIINYFDSITGLSNNFAESKTKIAQNIVACNNINLKKTWVIGDTIHDFEVAQQLGCKHILVANGHQSYKRLISLTDSVVKNLKEVRSLLNT